VCVWRGRSADVRPPPLHRGLMTRDPLTWDDLPEYPDDEEIGEVVLGKKKREQFRALADLREIDGMPKVDPFWGGRPKRLVRKFIESNQQVTAASSSREQRGPWHETKTTRTA
jgi:hypothetical protein